MQRNGDGDEGERCGRHQRQTAKVASARLLQAEELAEQQREDHGFQPRTVFDIGVGFGTWGLYRAFPDAFYHLVDPTPESLPYMHKLTGRLRGQVHPLALGDHDGEAKLEIRADIQGSTLLEEVGQRDFLRF